MMLPNRNDEEIMCCNYNEQLFIMFFAAGEWRGYIFNHDKEIWKIIFAYPGSKSITEIGKAIMFCYNNNIFVKGFPFHSRFHYLSNFL